MDREERNPRDEIALAEQELREGARILIMTPHVFEPDLRHIAGCQHSAELLVAPPRAAQKRPWPEDLLGYLEPIRHVLEAPRVHERARLGLDAPIKERLVRVQKIA